MVSMLVSCVESVAGRRYSAILHGSAPLDRDVSVVGRIRAISGRCGHRLTIRSAMTPKPELSAVPAGRRISFGRTTVNDMAATRAGALINGFPRSFDA